MKIVWQVGLIYGYDNSKDSKFLSDNVGICLFIESERMIPMDMLIVVGSLAMVFLFTANFVGSAENFTRRQKVKVHAEPVVDEQEIPSEATPQKT